MRRGGGRLGRRPISAGMSALGALALIAFACGGSTQPDDLQGGAAGDGTIACQMGDTRACVGPAACRGGQYCGAEGWQACECAASGAAGANAEPKDEVGGMGAGGSAGADGFSPEGGQRGSHEDEACPESRVECLIPSVDCTFDCVPGCEAAAADCVSTSTCRMEATTAEVTAQFIDDGMAIVRVPRAEVIGGPCDCADGLPIYAKFLSGLSPATPLPEGTRYEVQLPWHLGLPTDSTGCAPSEPSQCQNHEPMSRFHRLQVWTTDPNAGAVNVVMRRGPCPG